MWCHRKEPLLRHTLLALIVILGIAATASAQGRRMVVVSDGAFRAEMRPATEPYETQWPLVMVPARALKIGVEPTVPEFWIRAWQEGEGVRVLVFAVAPWSADRGRLEEQIVSVFVPIDQSIEIPATEKYLARRLTLSAYRNARQPPYVVESIRAAQP